MNDPEVATSPAEAARMMAPPESSPSNPEFEETMRLIEADKAKKRIELEKYRSEQEKKPTEKLADIMPLALEYKFTGQDPEGHEVTTIMLDTEAGYFANAYCLVERKQIVSVKVVKLPRVIMAEKPKK